MLFCVNPKVASPRSSRAWSLLRVCVRSIAALFVGSTVFAADRVMETFERDVQPVLDQYCYDCHGNGSEKGGIKLDEFADGAALQDHKLWLRALKNVRSHIMPPADEEPLPPEEAEKLMNWIKREAFQLDPAQPDPGRVTVRRLNRVEYRNTIRELTGVDYDTQLEFPADDTGHGFDNIGDVLTISPMLMEKYLDAAQAVITKAVPTQSRVVAEHAIDGREFATVQVPSEAVTVTPDTESGEKQPAETKAIVRPKPAIEGHALDLSYYTPVTVAKTYQAPHSGKYQLVINLKSIEHYVDDQFDYNRCKFVFKADGEKLFEQEFVREGEKSYTFTFDRNWTAGGHELTLEIHPIGPDQPQNRLLRLRVRDVTVRGPMEKKYWVPPANYTRFFPGEVPSWRGKRTRYAREVLTRFATRAFRRPVDSQTIAQLTDIALKTAAEPGSTFEAGIAQAMVAVLASPRFIFREEGNEPLKTGHAYALVDEYSLASRMSYFLWSSMPDEELFKLAAEHKLRANLAVQIDRMLKDARSNEFVRNFSGQWLQARDIGTVPINAFDIFLREHPNPDFDRAREAFRTIAPIPEDKRTPEQVAEFAAARKAFFAFRRLPKPDFSDSLRDAMQKETEMYFGYVIHEDRSLLELIESKYTFLNEPLAKHYGIAGVTGKQMRKVDLPPDSPRGGVLTQGTVLAVTSNPTRTSPVKRGVFILEAILGTPPAPPPPNIPALEDAASPDKLAKMSLRENLALHASNKMCSSCHSRMDPLGLALENFNAMGKWRDSEMGQPIEPAGKLVTGETFADVRELKHVLATAHREDFYHAFSEKLLTYALGRGLEYYDTDTIDQLVSRLDETQGRPSALIRGIIESAPFQQRRQDPAMRVSEEDAAGKPSRRISLNSPTNENHP